jgi:hypothetical protein
MRIALALAAALAIGFLPPSVGRAHAQCAVGCVSSSSCEGTGKGTCMSTCDTGGTCACTDRNCETQVLPYATIAASAPGVLFAATGDARPLAASLVVACDGSVVDLLLTRGGEPLFEELQRIVLRPTREAELLLASVDGSLSPVLRRE